MKKTIYILGIIITILLGCYLQHLFCCSCDKDSCASDTEVTSEKVMVEGTAIPALTLNGFSLKSGGFNINHPENYQFKSSSFAFNQPLSADFVGKINSTIDYFKQNPNQILEIEGYYGENETNDSAFPTLGLARANAVKNDLVARGFPIKQIKIDDELTDKVGDDTDAWQEFTTYKIDETDEEYQQERLQELKAFAEELKANPIRLYFETGASNINLTADERSKISTLNDYMAQVDKAKILVIGNTDNTGSRESNLDLGKKRADFIKNYLVRNNFNVNLIEVVSNGPDKPIADNATKEGLAKNRRVEITLK